MREKQTDEGQEAPIRPQIALTTEKSPLPSMSVRSVSSTYWYVPLQYGYAPEVLSLSGLTGAQKKTLIKLRNELLSPSQKGNDLSPQQMEILHDIIKAFG